MNDYNHPARLKVVAELKRQVLLCSSIWEVCDLMESYHQGFFRDGICQDGVITPDEAWIDSDIVVNNNDYQDIENSNFWEICDGELNKRYLNL